MEVHGLGGTSHPPRGLLSPGSSQLQPLWMAVTEHGRTVGSGHFHPWWGPSSGSLLLQTSVCTAWGPVQTCLAEMLSALVCILLAFPSQVSDLHWGLKALGSQPHLPLEGSPPQGLACPTPSQCLLAELTLFPPLPALLPSPLIGRQLWCLAQV